MHTVSEWLKSHLIFLLSYFSKQWRICSNIHHFLGGVVENFQQNLEYISSSLSPATSSIGTDSEITFRSSSVSFKANDPMLLSRFLTLVVPVEIMSRIPVEINCHKGREKTYRELERYHLPDAAAMPKLVGKVCSYTLQTIPLLQHNEFCFSLNSLQKTAELNPAKQISSSFLTSIKNITYPSL